MHLESRKVELPFWQLFQPLDDLQLNRDLASAAVQVNDLENDRNAPAICWRFRWTQRSTTEAADGLKCAPTERRTL
jgi:hypothetical protein